MARLSWLGRAARNRHRHAIEQASRRWRGGRRGDSARTRRKILISTQAATLPFEFLWLRYVFAEGATLLFYAATGYKFRPREDNPYLAVRAEELEEFGLGGGDAEEPGEAAAPA
jgi:hypothetical protein